MKSKRNKILTFKNNALLRSCISKINNTSIDNAKDLDIVMAMYNLLEYCDKYSMTSGSLWNFYRDEINDDANENVNNRVNKNKTITSKYFEYKTKLIGSISDDNNVLGAEVVVSLKYLSNFWRFLDLPLINRETGLNFSWSKKCIISKIVIIPSVRGNPNGNPPVPDVAAIQKTGATFQTNKAKLYVPVVTLSVNDNIKFLENLKQVFKRTISWKKYRSEITTQTKNNNLDYLIGPTFTNINRLFVLSFKNCSNDPTRDSFDKYHMPLVEIKDFNALINDHLLISQ